MSRDANGALFARIGTYAKYIPAILAWLRRSVFGDAVCRPGPECREKPRGRCDD